MYSVAACPPRGNPDYNPETTEVSGANRTPTLIEYAAACRTLNHLICIQSTKLYARKGRNYPPRK